MTETVIKTTPFRLNLNHFLGPRLWWMISIGYILSIAFSLKSFKLWNQVQFFWDKDPNLALIKALENKNGLRYFLVKHNFLLGEMTGISPDYFFSFEVGFFILFTAYLVSKITLLSRDRAHEFWPLLNINTICLIGLSLFMNGRLAGVFAGIALLQLTLMEKMKGKLHHPLQILFRVFMGIVLCSFSSGTFLVANATLFAWLVLFPTQVLYQHKQEIRDWVLLLLIIALFGCFSNYVMLTDIFSEVRSYNYNIIDMLEHGTGRIIWKLGLAGVGILLVMAGFFIFSFIYVWNRYPEFRLNWIIIACSLSLGIFGYSTILTCLPTLLVLSNLRLLNWSTSPQINLFQR